MKIVIVFCGGSLDNVTVDCETQLPNDGSDTAGKFYSATSNCQGGRQLVGRNGKGFERYKVVERWEIQGTVILKANVRDEALRCIAAKRRCGCEWRSADHITVAFHS